MLPSTNVHHSHQSVNIALRGPNCNVHRCHSFRLCPDLQFQSPPVACVLPGNWHPIAWMCAVRDTSEAAVINSMSSYSTDEEMSLALRTSELRTDLLTTSERNTRPSEANDSCETEAKTWGRDTSEQWGSMFRSPQKLLVNLSYSANTFQ